jgi:hypothetical protein
MTYLVSCSTSSPPFASTTPLLAEGEAAVGPVDARHGNIAPRELGPFHGLTAPLRFGKGRSRVHARTASGLKLSGLTARDLSGSGGFYLPRSSSLLLATEATSLPSTSEMTAAGTVTILLWMITCASPSGVTR